LPGSDPLPVDEQEPGQQLIPDSGSEWISIRSGPVGFFCHQQNHWRLGSRLSQVRLQDEQKSESAVDKSGEFLIIFSGGNYVHFRGLFGAS